MPIDIEESATSPRSASTDAGSVEAHPLPDLIEAEKHESAKTALTGTNAQGGPKSIWSKFRPAQAKLPGGV